MHEPLSMKDFYPETEEKTTKINKTSNNVKFFSNRTIDIEKINVLLLQYQTQSKRRTAQL